MSRALAIFKMIYTRCCKIVLMFYNAQLKAVLMAFKCCYQLNRKDYG